MGLDMRAAMKALRQKRKCYVSEADFQLELAWVLKDMYPDALVRCEYVPEFNTNVHMDILVIKDGKWHPIELKYKTKGAALTVDNEKYVLKNHGAKDIGCYLFLYDIYRIETIKDSIGSAFAEGYAIMLTNELSYCKPPRKKDCVYSAFTLENGCIKHGHLDWAESTGEGTKKQCRHPIVLKGAYECHWEDYSEIESTEVGIFRFLEIKVV